MKTGYRTNAARTANFHYNQVVANFDMLGMTNMPCSKAAARPYPGHQQLFPSRKPQLGKKLKRKQQIPTKTPQTSILNKPHKRGVNVASRLTESQMAGRNEPGLSTRGSQFSANFKRGQTVRGKASLSKPLKYTNNLQDPYGLLKKSENRLPISKKRKKRG